MADSFAASALRGALTPKPSSGGGFGSFLNTASSFLGPIGGIVSGISGLFGGKQKRGPDADDMILANARNSEEQFRTKMEMAKEYNIHPLSMLGVPFESSVSGQFGSQSSGSSTADAISNAGQGISRAVSAWTDREDRALAKRSAQLSVENQELQNARLRSEITLMHGTGSPPGMSTMSQGTLPAGSQDARYPEQAKMPLGYGNTMPLHNVARDHNGNMLPVLNPDVGDSEILQALHAFGFTIPSWLYQNSVKPLGKLLRENAPRYNPKYRR